MTDVLTPPQDINSELFTFSSPDLEGLELGAGKDASAYDIGGGLVYRKGHKMRWPTDPTMIIKYEEHLAREIETYASLPDSVSVARTLMAWIGEERVHKLIEKGHGRPLFPHLNAGESALFSEWRAPWEDAIALAAGIPDEHYQKLINDEDELRQRNILMDYIGLGNLLYDPVNGFTILDAEFEPQIPLRGKSMYVSLIGSDIVHGLIGNDETWVGNISSLARDSTIEVLQKLDRLGYQPKYRLSFQILCEKLDYRPSYADQH